MNLAPWNEIARAGTWTAMSGQSVNLTEADLDRIAAAFTADDPDGAPLVFGHPTVDAPAYGWVSGLRREGDRLLAAFRDVPEAVKSLVDAGRYRNVSVKLSPDKGRLVHVGLLGAAPPAIKGLLPVKFSAGDGLTIEFSSGGDMNELEQARARIRELEAENAKLTARVAELEGQSKAAQDKAATAEKAFADYRIEEAGRGREKRFAELVKAGKALPGEKAKTLAFAEALAASTGDLEFASSDGQTVKVAKEEAYWRELEARPENNLCQEFAAPTGSGKPGGAVPADLTKHV